MHSSKVTQVATKMIAAIMLFPTTKFLLQAKHSPLQLHCNTLHTCLPFKSTVTHMFRRSLQPPQTQQWLQHVGHQPWHANTDS